MGSRRTNLFPRYSPAPNSSRWTASQRRRFVGDRSGFEPRRRSRPSVYSPSIDIPRWEEPGTTTHPNCCEDVLELVHQRDQAWVIDIDPVAHQSATADCSFGDCTYDGVALEAMAGRAPCRRVSNALDPNRKGSSRGSRRDENNGSYQGAVQSYSADVVRKNTGAWRVLVLLSAQLLCIRRVESE